MTIAALAFVALFSTSAAQAANPWDAWERIPVLDDGRIKPLDTRAREIAILLTTRQTWTEPAPDPKPAGFKARKYSAAELLFAIMAEPEVWFKKPVLRCEYRELRLLLGVPEREMFVSLADVIDLEASRPNGQWKFPFKYRSEKFADAVQRVEAQRRRAMQSGKMNASLTSEGEFSAELLKKTRELVQRMEFLIGLADGQVLHLIPGLDPRALTTQANPDSAVQPWILLAAALDPDRAIEYRDPTLVAMLMDSPDNYRTALMDIRYPQDLGRQLLKVKAVQAELLPPLRELRPLFEKAQDEYRKGGASSSAFESALKAFANQLRSVSEKFDAARKSMAPDENDQNGVDLDVRQMALSAYPPPGGTGLEVFYNHQQPFYWVCYLLALASLAVLLSMIVPAQRTMYGVALVLAGVSVAYATFGFVLRVLVAGRPPVTNMYETVIWVSYVVNLLGLFLALSPRTGSGIAAAWRYAGLSWTWEGRRTADNADIPDASLFVSALTTVLRAMGFFLIFCVLTSSGTEKAADATADNSFASMLWALISGRSSFAIISRMPRSVVTYGVLSIDSLLTWIVGMTTVAIVAWYFPRFAVAALYSPATVLASTRRKTERSVWDGLLDNRFFLLSSLLAATFGMVLAAYTGVQAPDVMNPGVTSIAAVLRDNYWLTIHVLTIVSSYAAGALVWALGNIAMLYYLFGRYTPAKTVSPSAALRPAGAGDGAMDRLKTAGRGLAPSALGQTLMAGVRNLGSGDESLNTSSVLPPREVNTLAAFGYTGMKIAVLLLAAGTILGGLWADASWGRFWDWDPKEVWALISLLVYLAFLHGRYAGWVGTFGTNLGSVLCFQAIVFSWYGVNFLLPMIHGWLRGDGQATAVGLHSYAVGAGGQEYVGIAVALNLLLVLAAWARYATEIGLGSKSRSGTVGSNPAEAVTGEQAGAV
jgi:ABC-type transport system involved in cytochrome c biogenesis permease subunit